jgi:transglutaminase-like putative cysteine protease
MRRDAAAPYLAAFATLLAVATILPVLSSASWVGDSLLMIVVVLLSGLALRAVLRSPGLVLLSQAALGIIVLTALFARDTAVLGFLPGPSALSSLGQLAADGMAGTRHFATPAPPVPGIKLLLTSGVLGAAMATDFLAVTLGTTIAAGLPLLALYCVPAAVLPHGASPISFAFVAGGWLLMVAHDGRVRVSTWGRVLRRGQERGRRRFGEDDLDVLGSSARRLGFAAVIGAIVVPLLLPTLNNGLLTTGGDGDGGGGGNGGLGATSINPILTLKQNLTARSNAPVLTYTTNQPNPSTLRLVTDDVFDGETWRTSDGRATPNQKLPTTLPTPPGLSQGIPAPAYQMKVKVTTLDQGYLPVPYPARQVNVKGSWVFAPESLDVIGRGATTRKVSYSATYLDVQPTVAQLEAAPAPSDDVIGRDTDLPATLSPSIIDLARKLTAKADTEYAKAVALQTWFRITGGFTYDTTVDTSKSQDPVSAFLKSKHGYCVQFSSAMAVMARTLGIPARIGVGFLPGTRLTDGSRAVSLNDAHAWPELYFEGIGWVRFEPTPAIRAGAAPSYTEPNGTEGATDGASRATTAQGTNPLTTPNLAGKISDLQGRLGSTTTPTFTPVTTQPGTHIPVRLLIVGILVVLALLATPVAGMLARRRRRRRAGDSTARAEAAWAELLERAEDLGIDLAAGNTPRQTQAELVTRGVLPGEPGDALTRLVRSIEQARYAQHPVVPEGLSEDLQTVVRALRAATDRSRRLRARVLPRSGTDRLLGLSARAGERIAFVDRRIARTGRSVTRGPAQRPESRRRHTIFKGRPH